jgi:hypothetical protein
MQHAAITNPFPIEISSVKCYAPFSDKRTDARRYKATANLNTAFFQPVAHMDAFGAPPQYEAQRAAN